MSPDLIPKAKRRLTRVFPDIVSIEDLDSKLHISPAIRHLFLNEILHIKSLISDDNSNHILLINSNI